MSLPIHQDEPGRLAALASLAILDTEPEEAFDDVVRLAAALTDAPIAMINFVDSHRQWGKALIGMESSEVDRGDSFCARIIASDDDVLVVPDTLADPEWAQNPQVVGAPGLRFYAGASIVTAEGFAVGSVCVADRRARQISPEAIEHLRILARQTAAHLELRRRSVVLALANAELHGLAVRDPLTGLANRTLLGEQLGHHLEVRRRTGVELAVTFGDLDGFKEINDRLGHEAGDEILMTVARRLLAVARKSDVVARYGGDEFVVIHPAVESRGAAERVARRLTRAIAAPVEIAAGTVITELSAGVALAEDGDDVAGLLARADLAMYAEKRRRAAERLEVSSGG
jgi:diguanylate cyclase (GGDEF)-like protein